VTIVNAAPSAHERELLEQERELQERRNMEEHVKLPPHSTDKQAAPLDPETLAYFDIDDLGAIVQRTVTNPILTIAAPVRQRVTEEMLWPERFPVKDFHAPAIESIHQPSESKLTVAKVHFEDPTTLV
jgi:hypothetical protein